VDSCSSDMRREDGSMTLSVPLVVGITTRSAEGGTVNT